MPRYELASAPFMGSVEPPFAIVTTDADGTVVHIAVHPDAHSDGTQHAEHLIADFDLDRDSYPLNRLAVSYGSLRELPEQQQLFMACITVWALSGEPVEAPIVALRAASPDGPATQALPIMDTPMFREIADRFLQGASCRSVAETLTGGRLLGPHGVGTVLAAPLPEERPELIAMFGSLYSPRNSAPTASNPPNRRVVVRG